MCRAPIAALAFLVLATAPLDAQVSLGAATAPGISFHPPPAPAAVPAPAAPDRPVGPRNHVPTVPAGSDLFMADPGTYAPRFNRRPRSRTHAALLPYAIAPFPYFGPPEYTVRHDHDASHGSAAEQVAEPGYLRLDVEPLTAQVYVDGYFVGSGEDFTSPLPLEAGLHHIELRADGFDTMAFDLRLRPNETVRLTDGVVRLQPGSTTDQLTARATTDSAKPRASTIPLMPDGTPGSPIGSRPAAAKRLYVIPRCYAGDRMPVAAQLPAGCRTADVRVIAPDGR